MTQPEPARTGLKFCKSSGLESGGYAQIYSSGGEREKGRAGERGRQLIFFSTKSPQTTDLTHIHDHGCHLKQVAPSPAHLQAPSISFWVLLAISLKAFVLIRKAGGEEGGSLALIQT